MSVFRRGAGWVAKFQYRGEQVWVPGGPWRTKRQALEAERRHRDFIQVRQTEETCSSFAQRWLREWPRKAPASQRIYKRAADRFAGQFGSTPLDEVQRLEARAWALGIPRNLSGVIATMFEDARNVGLVTHNPFSNLRLPKTDRTREVVCPTRDEYRTLLNSCVQLASYAAEFRAFIQFTAWTCLRSGEVQALQHDDIEDDVIWVRRARRTDGTYGLPKNGKERRVAFLEPARVLDHVPRREHSPFIFHGARGTPLSHATLYHYWNKVRGPVNIERAGQGLPGIRFHDLRHFGATMLLEAGLSHFDVSVQLGHEDGGALVMARYGHPSKDKALERLLAAFSFAEEQSGSSAGSRVVD